MGLDLVLKWDAEVVHEETVRLETAYPEVPTLHSYTYLWLLDRLCSDRDLGSLSVPPVTEAYAGFMKRLVAHSDVRAGRSFAEGPELFRRTVYVECFRGAYHDLLQRRGLWSTRTASVPIKLACPAPCTEPPVGPDEAASQIGAATTPSRRPLLASRNAEDTAVAPSQVSARSASVLKSAMLSANHDPVVETHRPQPKTAPHAVFALPRDHLLETRSCRLSEVGPPTDTQSLETKAITVTGPCFFGNEAQSE